MEKKRRNGIKSLIVAGVLIVAVILVLGTVWMGYSGRRDTEKAVRSVSLLYLDELAGRREQVVSENLQDRIKDMQTALELMTEEDLQDSGHLQAYQARIKRLFTLEKFGFVDEQGLIHTAAGILTNIDEYPFDYKTIAGPEISIKNLNTVNKLVEIAAPVAIPFQDIELVVCFMEIDMEEMLSGVSMQSKEDGATFCNIYTKDGIALSNTVLGGLAVEDNLLEAMKIAEFEPGYSYDAFLEDFALGRSGEVSFNYGGIRETLCYVPVADTDWLLTYLIRESVISSQISSISQGIIQRGVIQSALTILALSVIFAIVFLQNRRNAILRIEKEKSDTENRVKREELEHRLALQEQLLMEEEHRKQQENLIRALASDYRGVYYLELDTGEGICYQAHTDLESSLEIGEKFPYLPAITAYAEQYVTEPYREEFLNFVQPDAIRAGLEEQPVISCTYMVSRHGKDSYEMVRLAGVRRPEDRDDGIVHNVGACFTDVDLETRKAKEQQQALSDALATAEQANRAKTAFLSSMSHEIRTPMNAIIGLDNIALHDPQLTPKVREYLEKIGSSAEHLLNLINDILDMSRIESGRMILKNEEFSFSKLLEAINTMFSSQCSEKGLDYQCYIKGHVDAYYIGDNMKLRQVLINILGNAVKFTPQGGSVEVEVERKARYERQTTLCFTIRDTGIGISQEYLPHIFDTFSQEDDSTTSKYGSSGLGLAITRNIVEMMNGTIEVESEKGKGTTFTVTVTLMTSDRGEGPDDFEEIYPVEMTVLIVDDDEVACEHARLVLEKAGIASETADSGARAVEMVRLRHARRDPYNLILVDWQMPQMDGVETSWRIRKEIGDESAIIILTAYRWDDILEEAVQAGVDSFIPKPLFAETVIEEFKTAMQRKNSMARAAKKKADLKGRRILLAEDMQINAEIMIMVLNMREIEVDLAENGKIAVEMFETHPEGYYDAVLMDMRMPVMDGLTATKKIRAMEREDAKAVPIIALTANAFDEDVQRSLQAGLNAHLSKPVDPDTLFATLESLIPA